MQVKTVNQLIADLMVFSLLGQGDRKVLLEEDKYGTKLRGYKGNAIRIKKAFAEKIELPDGITPEEASENCIVLTFGSDD